MIDLSRRGFLGAASAAGGALALTGSAHASASAEQDKFPAGEDGRIIIAAMSRPASLDPGLATDMESERIIRQIFEPLLGIDKETGALAPRLAEEWDVSNDQLRYTFTLREDVTFHDGSPLNAEAVVANIERAGRLDYLYGFGNISRSTPLAFPTVFGNFLGTEDCVLDSVEAEDDDTVVLTLSEPVSFLLQALTLPAFGIASPQVLSDSDPGLVSRRPVGTGPYRLHPTEGPETVLESYPDYWGDLSGPEQVVVRPLPRSFDRLRELNRGQADVYDGITADNLRSLVQAGRLILQRDPFSILYMGFNVEHPIMADAQIREAAARAINRESLAAEFFLEGTRAAYQFTPAALGVHSDAARRYSYDPEQARQLLEESDYDGEPLDFHYPLATTRSYLPQPEAVFAAVAADLTSAGFIIRPRPVPWDQGYVEQLMGDENRAMHLLGRNGGFRSPHTFLGPLFGRTTREFHYSNEEVFDVLAEARAESEEEPRAELYRQAAELISEDLPAVPLAYPISGLALGPRVADYPMSPVLNERFSEIVTSEEN
ncbi:ABC transporter substrate-binding protein [Nesterenkonia sp.]|uniref:ABC transporter substrate-binding protein n=1 Tax=Nesterenkonia sp. TaxID=704201 RepID=UPI0026287EB6|nr:ABC transporter substrate-binding protein [Nesterenkonia sp.]